MVAQRSQSLPEGGFCARFRREIRGTAVLVRRRYGAGDGGDVPVVRWIRRRCERLEVSFITPKPPSPKFAGPHTPRSWHGLRHEHTVHVTCMQ